MPELREVLKRFLRGNNRTAVFAITSCCNCKCMMCDMHRKPPKQIDFNSAKKVLDSLAENRFLIVYFTGGEPTLHPEVERIVAYADKLGLVTAMTTNGTAPTDKLKALMDSGLYLMSVSLDHWNAEVCEKIRKYPDIQRKQMNTIRYLRQIGLRTYALVYLNPILLEDGVEKLISYVDKELDVPFGFCYPTWCNSNSYSLGGTIAQSGELLSLRRATAEILNIKRKGGRIANLFLYLEDTISFPSYQPNFYCRGGEDVIYVDWNADAYPCFKKDQRLFNFLDDSEPKFLKNVRCNECLINCFREPSLLPQLFSSINLLAKELIHSYSSRGIYK